jgi:hypothetical protein
MSAILHTSVACQGVTTSAVLSNKESSSLLNTECLDATCHFHVTCCFLGTCPSAIQSYHMAAACRGSPSRSLQRCQFTPKALERFGCTNRITIQGKVNIFISEPWRACRSPRPTGGYRPSTGHRLPLCQLACKVPARTRTSVVDKSYKLSQTRNIAEADSLGLTLLHPTHLQLLMPCLLSPAHAVPVFLCIKHLQGFKRLAAVLRTGILHEFSCSKWEVSEACTIEFDSACHLCLSPPPVCTAELACCFYVELCICCILLHVNPSNRVHGKPRPFTKAVLVLAALHTLCTAASASTTALVARTKHHDADQLQHNTVPCRHHTLPHACSCCRRTLLLSNGRPCVDDPDVHCSVWGWPLSKNASSPCSTTPTLVCS